MPRRTPLGAGHEPVPRRRGTRSPADRPRRIVRSRTCPDGSYVGLSGCGLDQLPWEQLSGAADGVRVRHQHRVVPDRGGVGRGRQGPEHLGHLHRASPGKIMDGSDGAGRLRPLPPLRRGRRADEAAGPRRLPVLDLLAADPARRAPGRPTRPVSTSTTGSSTSSSPPASSRWRRSSTGTCRRPLQDARRLAGPRDRRALRGVRRARAPSASATGSASGCRSTSPTWSPCSATAIGEHAPGQALGFDALPVAHHLNLAHGLAVQALRANGAARGRHRHQPHARLGRPPTSPRTSPPPTSSTRCGTGSSPTRCCSAATRRASRS